MDGVLIGPPLEASPPKPTLAASASQRAAIEAELGPVLVLAGPGAGKTFCLIERIRFLIADRGLDPARIRAFTFTNKAAEEIGSRLGRDLGTPGEHVRRGTIHACCAELLREFGDYVRLERGFGIADEPYQKALLGRLGVSVRAQDNVLRNFTRHRIRGQTLSPRDTQVLEKYSQALERRNLVDFDGLVIKTAELLRREAEVARQVRSRWDYILVDEFQDLNPRQYDVVHELAREHRNLFAVGDNEQSIFSWTGADPTLFGTFMNDFRIIRPYPLEENHRCPKEAFDPARRLVLLNTPFLGEHRDIRVERRSGFPVQALGFADQSTEASWLLDDLMHDRLTHGLRWGDYAVLYRKHEIGSALEASLVTTGIPCRLASGRALAEDPVVGYLVAALRVIVSPSDHIHREQFLRAVLPAALCSSLQARAEENNETLWRQALVEANRRSVHDEDGRKLRRARAAQRNLEALGRKHATLGPLVEELLSQRVGAYRTVLEERHEELSDPAGDPFVVKLGERLAAARDEGRPVWLAPMGAVGVPLKSMLEELGFRVAFGGARSAAAEPITHHDTPSLGIGLGLFKSLQLVVSRRFATSFTDFTAIDIETTDRDTSRAEIVELAAVRVRGGVVAGSFHTLVKPRQPISPGAAAAHGLTDAELAAAPFFEAVWSGFRAFCGNDIVVAHNGYKFDFPILRRMSAVLGGDRFCTYDTLVLARELRSGGRKLEDLAHAYGIDPGQAHRALDDARTLAAVCLRLEEDRLVRARKTALANLLDLLGVALALSDQEALGMEARELSEIARRWALGRYSDALDTYRAERDLLGDPSLPTGEQLIHLLGGPELMMRIRAERTSDQRYPAAMKRLRRLLDRCAGDTLRDQIAALLELLALSRQDGVGIEPDRVNLLTLHSTKGLEFSRVYVVGAEDAELPGMWSDRTATLSEVEEARRLLYVGMTRAKERLVLTRAATRDGKHTGGHRFLDEMGLTLRPST